MNSIRQNLGTVLSRFGLRRGPESVGPSQEPLDFNEKAVPWIDRPDADIGRYIAALGKAKPVEYDLRAQLEHWRKFGFAVFPKLVPDELIDLYREDVDELVSRRAQFDTRVLVEGLGVRKIRETTFEQLQHPHARLLDFHNQSVAAKQIILHPTIVSFASHIFRDKVVAMQTITFWRGSEQTTHQDFAYVVSQIPSHLCATWIALEDVSLDAGPLEYFPGSHRLPKFDFGNGLFISPESTKDEMDFRDHLERECASAGIVPAKFAAKKGDVFFWHAALAHRGGKVDDSRLTRFSLVAHYSSRKAYPHDRRAMHEKPRIFEVNGGLVYADPTLGDLENCFLRGSTYGAV